MAADPRGYYKILGLKPGASQKEIRSAYISLSRKYHPDANPDANAAEQFRKVQEAYACLSDTQKKSRYDAGESDHAFQGGGDHSGFGFSGDFGDFADLGKIFDQMFRQGDGRTGHTQQQSYPENLGLVLDRELSLEEAYAGLNVTVSYVRNGKCAGCYGTGGASSRPCSACNGSGQRRVSRGFFMLSQTCDRCGGRRVEVCGKCSGAGTQRESVKQDIDIPPGVKNNDRIIIKGQGSFGGGRFGDLYVQVRVKTHEVFQCDERGDLHLTATISLAEALLGCELHIPCLDGSVQIVRVPAGTRDGSHMTIPGKGITSTRNMVAHMHIELPQNLTPEQLQFIRTHLHDDVHYPKAQSFKQRLSGYRK